MEVETILAAYRGRDIRPVRHHYFQRYTNGTIAMDAPTALTFRLWQASRRDPLYRSPFDFMDAMAEVFYATGAKGMDRYIRRMLKLTEAELDQLAMGFSWGHIQGIPFRNTGDLYRVGATAASMLAIPDDSGCVQEKGVDREFWWFPYLRKMTTDQNL